jgi:uncharacterized protein (UPF0333 family)
MDVKGQGALEYLLLIGGAVLVAAIVIALISGMPTSLDAEARTYCQSYFTFSGCQDADPVTAVAAAAAGSDCCPRQIDGTGANDQTDFYTCEYDSSGVCA